MSYHLGLLRKADLVRTRRSSADGRDIYYRFYRYYRLDLVRCGQLLTAAGGALHPGLRLRSRSQMAEALLCHRSGGAVAAFSAGSRPKPIHPDAVAAPLARTLTQPW
ncbi:hypothetical protein [Dactylosporangium sp. NPDC049140]|uniref:hypothetical protein n=1 Tax=Dactylosporangium sp. NPDC049140 TaxID=3155647 RepID=UPI0033F9FC81